jgi:large subunit ribosomal protein L25
VSQARAWAAWGAREQAAHPPHASPASPPTHSEVDGKVEVVLPRDVQLHPFLPKIINVNWVRYTPGRYPGVRVDLPLRVVNEERSPGLKEGGWLLELVHKVPVLARGYTIPQHLVMDMRGKRKGDKVMASELDLHAGIELRSVQADFAVARIVGSRRGGEEAAEEAAPGGKKDEKAAKPAAAADKGAAKGAEKKEKE